MKKKLIKFDIIHPQTWLVEKKREVSDLPGMSLAEYRQWLIGLASNYADFYTYPLNESGAWEAEEYFLLDPDFEWKVARELWGAPQAWIRKVAVKVLERIAPSRMRWSEHVLESYVRRHRFEVLFARSQPIRSAFWQRFRADHLLVARLSARLPHRWHPNDFDLIYTDQPDFKTFFELHGVPTIMNKQGFDPRIIDRLPVTPAGEGVVFVGGLGTRNFSQRTDFLEQLAGRVPNFRWWGYWWTESGDGRTLADFPNLQRTFQGPTSGLEMYRIYYDALVVVNDYVDTANGIGFNQRMFEVMGCGGMLLTRAAPNFADDFPPDLFATYDDLTSCLTQIERLCADPERSRAYRTAARKHVLEHFNYRDIAEQFGRDVTALLERR